MADIMDQITRSASSSSQEPSRDSSSADYAKLLGESRTIGTKTGKERYAVLLSQEKKFYENLAVLNKKYNADKLKEELQSASISAERRAEIERQLQSINEKAVRMTNEMESRAFNRLSKGKQAQVRKEQAQQVRSSRERLKQEYDERIASAETGKEKQALEKQYQKDLRKNQQSEIKLIQSKQALTKTSFKENIKLTKEQRQAKIASNKEDIEALRDIRDEQKVAGKDTTAVDKALKDAVKQNTKDEFAQDIDKMATAIGDAFTKSFDGAFDNADRRLSEYKGHLDARLQGTQDSYLKATQTIGLTLGVSPTVQIQKVLDAIVKLSDAGVAYNLEQRAFLGVVADKIATTFDAFDSNLLRLVRLQQADTTAARLGMEAQLTRFLNASFQDTSYLTSNLVSTVEETLTDALSQMTRDVAAEFEYTTNKWLSSLTSLGLSSQAVNLISQGIGYLATGDVVSLTSNTQLETLMAMSASNAGLDFAKMLLNSPTVEELNTLMRSMTEYLQRIANEASSNVTRAAYGNILGLSMSDLRAFANLTADEISTISDMTLNYNQMISETNTQLREAAVKRTSVSEMINNAYQNAAYSVASDFANNPATNAFMKMLKFMEENEVELNIPTVSVMGSSLDLETSLTQLMRIGVMGATSLGMVGRLIGALATGTGFGTNLSSSLWGATEYTQRGVGAASYLTSLTGDTSSITYVASSSASDLKRGTLSQAVAESAESTEITGKGSKTEYTFDDFYKAVVESDNHIRVTDPTIQTAFMESEKSLRVQLSNVETDHGALLVKLKTEDLSNIILLKSNQNYATISKAIKEALGFNEASSKDQRSMVQMLQSLVDNATDSNKGIYTKTVDQPNTTSKAPTTNIFAFAGSY